MRNFNEIILTLIDKLTAPYSHATGLSIHSASLKLAHNFTDEEILELAAHFNIEIK